MNRLCGLILLAGLVVVSLSAAVSAAPMEFTHQGRLLDESGVPIDGNVTMLFRIFDSSTGGSLIWSETHPSVLVTDGLYSVVLGSSTPLDADVFSPPSSGGLPPVERYLEIEVGGEVITPRTRFVSSPYAISAVRVDGDLLTSPGTLRLGTSSGTTGVVSAGSSDGTGYYFGHSQGSNVGVGSLRVEPDSVICLQGLDVDSDGFPDQEISTSVVPTKSQHAINTKGTGAQNGRVVSVRSETTVDSATQVIQVDDDGDGIAESSIIRVSNPDWADISMSAKSIGAPIRSSLSISVAGQTQGSALRQMCDLNDDGNPETSAQTLVMADSIVDHLDLDSDDDGIADAESLTRLLGHELTHVVQQRSGVGLNQVTMISETKADTGGVSQELGIKKGINAVNVSVSHRTLVTSQAMSSGMIGDFDDDGFPEQEVSSSIIPTKSQMAINTKGTGAQNGRLVFVSGSTGVGSAVLVSGLDDDGDGVPEQEVSSAIIPTKSQHAINTKGTGAQNGRVVSISSETTVDSAIQASRIDHDGDGLADIAIAGACTIDSTYESTSFSYPNASAPVSVSGLQLRTRKSKAYLEIHDTETASRTAAVISCDSATSSSTWSADDFSGLPATSLTIQASTDPLLNPIEHSSGAHLTPGGSWTNSSDADLKENFELIDGDELLSKIDQLDIHEWNYISEADNVKHIGPTAQDFEKTFNLGSDGKSISTIDPAGIALAAIKALNEKSKRVDELEKEVQELKRVVGQLLNGVK